MEEAKKTCGIQETDPTKEKDKGDCQNDGEVRV